MKLNYKALLTFVIIAIFVGAIFSVQAQLPTLYLNAQDASGTPIQIQTTGDSDPTGTQWHEIYPTFSIVRTITGWIDNGDKHISPSDQVEFDSDGNWFHVKQVLTTIHWDWKSGWPDPTPDVESASETDHLGDDLAGVPPSGNWHQIYPPSDFSRPFRITSHDDTNGDGLINPSEQFDMTYDDVVPPEVRWAHLTGISTDIVVGPKDGLPEFPFGLELGLGLGLAVAIIYVAWKRRPFSTKKL